MLGQLAVCAQVIIGMSPSLLTLTCACCVREAIVVVARPFQSSAQLTSAVKGSSGAFSGWRECLKAVASACGSFLSGWLVEVIGPRAPFVLASGGLAIQALAYLQDDANASSKAATIKSVHKSHSE